MNFNQLINTVVRVVTHRLINLGINKGIDFATRKGRKPEASQPHGDAQKQRARETAKRARQAAKVTRRLGRF